MRAFSVAVTLGSSRKTSARGGGGLELVPVRRGHRRAELLEGEKVGVDATPADDVAAGWWEDGVAATRQERTCQQDRGADPGAERRVQVVVTQPRGRDVELIPPGPFGLRPHRSNELDQCFGVPDARHVCERDRVLREERGGDDRESGVLVAGRFDGTRQPMPTFDDVLNRAHDV
jgi:hypothetical protein